MLTAVGGKQNLGGSAEKKKRKKKRNLAQSQRLLLKVQVTHEIPLSTYLSAPLAFVIQ